MIDLDEFPLGATIAQGLVDLQNGSITVPATVVAIASRRLKEVGLPIPTRKSLPRDPELALYQLLGSESDDPLFALRALRDGLDSFISCFEALNRAERFRATLEEPCR